jgi:N-methylhydantoinase B/oxoprolinase/acetone carboxylase alpha subunit
MSTTIENRIVEMRFDNDQFEKEVKTSLSTLDKLKQALDFKGATKGLESVANAGKAFNLSGVSMAVTTVTEKFSEPLKV